MLRELVDLAARLRAEGVLQPIAYKPRSVNWVVDLTDAGQPRLVGPFKRDQFPPVMAPMRQRSGKISPDNLKPYLIVDDARYALGIPEAGKEDEAALAHQGFVDLLRTAYEHTHEPDLATILQFLEGPLPEGFRRQIAPKEIVAFRCDPAVFACERESVQRFWASYLGDELTTGAEGTCLICGQRGRVLRILPLEVVIMGQKCQVSSFNLGAFESFGKSQTENAPLCYRCVSGALQALDYLLRDPCHHTVIARDPRKGDSSPLRNQVAVFWLREPARLAQGDVTSEIEASVLAALVRDEPRREDPASSPPDLGELERLLAIPWREGENVLCPGANRFCLAILTANKGRLMVREWISVSLRELHEHLRKFVQATRIVDPGGAATRSFTIPELLSALDNGDSGLITQLTCTAYRGVPPPRELRDLAVLRLRAPDRSTTEQWARRIQERQRHALAAALKLVLTYDLKEAKDLEQVDYTRDDPAYLCGRLLAIVEEIQRRASGGKLNSTLVERFYVPASSTPATTFGSLVRLAEVAYLPKLRRARLGYERMQRLIEDVWTRLRRSGNDVPTMLASPKQAEFALGFYCQRAAFRAEWERRRLGAAKGHEPSRGVA